jgi:HrpA-like RNA helicase
MSSSKKGSSKKGSDPIGIFDIKGDNVNPFTKEPYQNLYSTQQMDVDGQKVPMTYANLATKWSQLTVYKYKDELLDSIKNNQVTLAKAGTGVGKTVLIPKIALHAFNYEGKVLTTIPKRLITRSNAEYAAKCLDSKLGDHVGYYFKGDNKISKNSKLIFTTTGSILSKVTGNDPYLEEYNCIVIDEAHERSVQTDLLLLLIKNALKKRKDLRLVIMSATINLEAFRNYYKEFTFSEVDIPGLTFSVKQFWLPQRPENWYKSAVERVMKILTTTDEGDILIFGKASSDGENIVSTSQTNVSQVATKSVPLCSNIEPFSSLGIL